MIVNFLLNSGCRAATVRNIQSRDADLQTRQIILRHTKVGKIRVIPLYSLMVSILEDYMGIKGGVEEDDLFCDQYGGTSSLMASRMASALKLLPEYSLIPFKTPSLNADKCVPPSLVY